MCQLYELTREQLSSNPGSEFRTISRMNIVAFLSPNKGTDDLTLHFLDISEASKIKIRKNQGLLLSCTQANSSL